MTFALPQRYSFIGIASIASGLIHSVILLILINHKITLHGQWADSPLPPSPHLGLTVLQPNILSHGSAPSTITAKKQNTRPSTHTAITHLKKPNKRHSDSQKAKQPTIKTTSRSTNERETPHQSPSSSSLADNVELTAQSLRDQVAAMTSKTPITTPHNDKIATYESSTKDALWTQYVEGWIHKAERIGEVNFPTKGAQQNLADGPVLRIRLNADGSLQTVTILRHAKNRLLDEMAISIVKLSTPFAPFPLALADRYQALDIVRKWSFISHQSSIS